MKNLFVIMIATLSLSAFAAKMGPDAVEMYEVLSHPTVRDCLENAPRKMVNISIEKIVARCPGCNTYIVTGSELNIDIPSATKTRIKIVGKGVRGMFNTFAQTYTCDVE